MNLHSIEVCVSLMTAQASSYWDTQQTFGGFFLVENVDVVLGTHFWTCVCLQYEQFERLSVLVRS